MLFVTVPTAAACSSVLAALPAPPYALYNLKHDDIARQVFSLPPFSSTLSIHVFAIFLYSFPSGVLRERKYKFMCSIQPKLSPFFLNLFSFILERKSTSGGERQTERKRGSKRVPCRAWSPTWGLHSMTLGSQLSRNQELDAQMTEPRRRLKNL